MVKKPFYTNPNKNLDQAFRQNEAGHSFSIFNIVHCLGDNRVDVAMYEPLNDTIGWWRSPSSLFKGMLNLSLGDESNIDNK